MLRILARVSQSLPRPAATQARFVGTVNAEPTVADLLQRKASKSSGAAVSTISKESTIQSAARLMMTNKIGSIIVTDKGGDFQGIITERDLLKVADGTVERQSAVGEIMTGKAKILHCKRGDTVFAVMTLINSNNIRHVPVLTDNKVEAVLSIKDCIDHVIQEHQKELDTMKGFVSGSY